MKTLDKSNFCRVNYAWHLAQPSSISNLRKPVFNATCAVSGFYAN
ncbi:hypothetical protein T08_8974 [Trichinella sp. T8]|nr:hypothetical protein T08_8974 [Trichinella sp. T8]